MRSGRASDARGGGARASRAAAARALAFAGALAFAFAGAFAFAFSRVRAFVCAGALAFVLAFAVGEGEARAQAAMEPRHVFPLEPAGPSPAEVRPAAWFAPVYVLDAGVIALGVVEAARKRTWPGARWATAAAAFGLAQLVGGLAGVVSAARGDLDPTFVPHAAAATAIGAVLFGGALAVTARAAPAAAAAGEGASVRP